MRKAPTIKLDIPVRKELERLSRSRSGAVRLAERSRIVLLAAGGLDNQEIGAKLDITRQKAGRWRDRFVEDGLGGIEKDASRSGRIPSIGRRKRARIVKKTVEGKPPRRHALEPVLDGQGNRRQRVHGRENLAGSWLEASSGMHFQTVQRQTICREVGGCGRFGI